jgi:hypothetical protein
MRGFVIIVVIICGMLFVDHYWFDSFYTDRFLDMSQNMMRGLSR